ncbi:MAG: hypothetical protein K6A67_04675 [Bacteroidales bacterium]|nr:hypothetical protein [Bacteroidales bacterium]
MAIMFPYPAKKPGGCRFSGFADYANLQDYGEEEVEVNDKDFQFWEMIREDPDVVTLSTVGMDKQKRCLLAREYYIPRKPYGGTWKRRYFLIKRNVMASFLALAVIEGHTSMEKYKQLIHRLDGLVPATGDPEIDGCPPLQMTQEMYSRMKKEKQEKERKELEERKQWCADFWDKDVWKDDDCYLFFEGEEPILICHGKRYSFGYDGRGENTIIHGDGVKYLHMGFDVGAECRYFLKNPHGTTQSITGRQYDARLFCHLLFAAATSTGESLSIDEVEARLDRMMAQTFRAKYPTKESAKEPTKEPTAFCGRVTKTSESETKSQPDFPFPAKKPSPCRFPSNNDNANFQDYGEVPVKMNEADFHSWWFFYEDPDKPVMSYVGMDKHSQCILERRYVHGDLNHWTVEKRFFLIKRNVMASCLALALIEEAMERNDYLELITRLDRLKPITGDPKRDGCTPLVPPKELLEKKSQSEIEAEETEKERRALNGRVVWQDGVRKLYFEDREPIMIYKGERYTFSCHPYEPMAIILREGKAVAYIHNAFYPDECKNFIENRDYTVSTITGRHHNAERFCRLLTTAVDCFYDCQIDEVENEMQMDLVREKGVNALQFDARDFVCEKVLYEGIPLLLGYFERALSREYNVGKIYSIAYGYPGRNRAESEFYLLTEQEYHEYKKWPEKRQWKDTTEASRFLHQNLEGKKQMLCNELEKRPSIYKPSFTLGEILNPQETIGQGGTSSSGALESRRADLCANDNGFKSHHITYSRVSVCAADDYVNGEIKIRMAENATVGYLVDYIRHYHDENGYSAIPYTGGGNWWRLESDCGILAEVNDDGDGVRYTMNPSLMLKNLCITKVKGTRL